MSAKASPAVTVAKSLNGHSNGDGIVTLSTGIRGRFKSVPAMTIEAAQAMIKDPPVPLQAIEGRDHPVENPVDPDYIKARMEANRERGEAAIDVMVLFGLELVDGLPDDDTWLKQLKFLEKRGHLDLSSYDLKDEVEREFVYKRFIATGSDDLVAIGQMSGLKDKDVQAAREAFQGGAVGSTD